MSFAEKLKEIRKAAQMSQETLADKLGVSRQAVTKWETERGIPDIENIIMISNLFGVSVDELLSQEKSMASCRGFLYESRTEYDINGPKYFDMKLGGAAVLKVSGTDGEKLRVYLGSNEIEALEEQFKVHIDDIKDRIDVDVKRQSKMTEARAKEHLVMEILLPLKYLRHVELEVHCKELDLAGLECEHMEFGGRIGKILLDHVKGRVEIDCNLDMDIIMKKLEGSLKISQISATSRIAVPEDFCFRSIEKGLRTAISYQCDGKETEDFSDAAADNIIELTGMRNELVICRNAE